jgi:hypothetical protein
MMIDPIDKPWGIYDRMGDWIGEMNVRNAAEVCGRMWRGCWLDPEAPVEVHEEFNRLCKESWREYCSIKMYPNARILSVEYVESSIYDYAVVSDGAVRLFFGSGRFNFSNEVPESYLNFKPLVGSDTLRVEVHGDRVLVILPDYTSHGFGLSELK